MNSPNQSILNELLLINHCPIHDYERLRGPNYFDSKNLFCSSVNLGSSTLSIPISPDCYNQINDLLTERNFLDYKESKQDLKQKVMNVYYGHQKRNWDGYESEPVKHLISSLKFAETVSSEALTELIDIVPENDGCLCFEWFKSNNRFISVSVKDDKLIYNYKIGDEEGCGETTFAGKQMLVEQIKKVI